MGVNNLLKVLEQLLNKIKEDRQIDMEDQQMMKYITTQPDEVRFIEPDTYNLYWIYIKIRLDRESNQFMKQRIRPQIAYYTIVLS